MREPGFEPGSQPWQGRIIATILLSRSTMYATTQFIKKVSKYIHNFFKQNQKHVLYASVAQSVERHIGNVEVPSSILGGGINKTKIYDQVYDIVLFYSYPLHLSHHMFSQ